MSWKEEEVDIERCITCGGALEDGWCPACAEVAEDEAALEYGEIDEANAP